MVRYYREEKVDKGSFDKKDGLRIPLSEGDDLRKSAFVQFLPL